MNMSSETPERRTSSMYLILMLLGKVNVVKILFAKFCMMAKMLRAPMGSLVKVYYVPSKVKVNCS